ncbi:Vacuolar protein sorting/targeting protein 10 [Thelohanellus kitauei]|uniref:Vacuolar protein sorting/targeting protein 10 n=1 Tax=Thelohanellus kitauei TaxID=669202 RepID=A0A0C2I9D7_THEKT|nr:Vacuolar protein sorting/targeting protein 10 [Thelohanellus kitauei]
MLSKYFSYDFQRENIVYEMYVSRSFGNNFEHISDHVVEAAWIQNTSYIIYIANSVVRIIDVAHNYTEMFKFYSVKRFHQIRNEFIVIEYDQAFEKDMILEILHLNENKNLTAKIVHENHFGVKSNYKIYKKYNEFFYLNGALYILVWKNSYTLCLCTFNQYDQIIELVCDLSLYDTSGGKCSVVINPHLSGVIYANLHKTGLKTRTYASFDNGKNFVPLEFKDKTSECQENACGVELDLECSTDLIESTFPEKWMVKLKGTLHRKNRGSYHTFFSFNGGKSWKIVDSHVENLTILNRGSVLFGTEVMSGRIWFSYNEGWSWYRQDIAASNIIDVKPIESPNTQLISAIDYDMVKKVFSLFIFDFSHVLNRTCEDKDYAAFYITRFSGNCFQGQEVYFWKKKADSVCVDNRNSVLQMTRPCPCSPEDFQCERNYYFKDNFCVLNPYSNAKESVKKCRDGGTPLNNLNGFAKLNPDICSSRHIDLDEDSEYCDYCISNNFSIQIFVFFNDNLQELQLDYKGGYLPASEFIKNSLPMRISAKNAITYDPRSKAIYLFLIHTIYRFDDKTNNFTSDKTSLYRLSFGIVSMAYDYWNTLLFFLDTHSRLFVISLTDNYIKLLSSNVTSFQFHMSSLAISFSTFNQICYYRMFWNIICFDAEMNIRKYVYSPESQYHFVLLQNNTLFIAKHPIGGKSIIHQEISLKLSQPMYIENPIEINHPYGSSMCQYTCNPLIRTADFCYCSDSNESPKEYMCKEGDAKCLNKLCVGFRCNNGQCRRNNIRCDRIDDCGDNTDEKNCDQTCSDNKHLCQGKCILKSKICPDLSYEYLDPDMPESVPSKSRTDVSYEYF